MENMRVPRLDLSKVKRDSEDEDDEDDNSNKKKQSGNDADNN